MNTDGFGSEEDLLHRVLEKKESVISISALIYKSTIMADVFYEQLIKHTPWLRDGRARFFFVANDATDEVKEHLVKKGYPHIIQDNEMLSEAELFALGYSWPEYMHRVYVGYNRAITEGDEWVVLLNSDNFVSPGWLEGLVQQARADRVVASGLVERKHPVYAIFPGALHAECGGSADTYDEELFLNVARNIRAERGGQVTPGGAFMPCLLHRGTAVKAGLYPEGNIAGSSFGDIFRSGDAEFFVELGKLGVDHLTAWDSVVYHLKEGEIGA